MRTTNQRVHDDTHKQFGYVTPPSLREEVRNQLERVSFTTNTEKTYPPAKSDGSRIQTKYETICSEHQYQAIVSVGQS